MNRNEYMRNYYEQNPEQKEKHLSKMREYAKGRYGSTQRENSRKYAQKRRLKVLSHYSISGIIQCANPFGEHKEPYTNTDALTIDHINDDGYKHRKVIGNQLYLWLVRNNYPSGFQVLCHNCQWIKRIKYLENIKR